MRWRLMVVTVLLSSTLVGCDKLPLDKLPFIGKKSGDTTAVDTATQIAAAPAAPDSAQVPPEPQAAATPTPRPIVPTSTPARSRSGALFDEPWFPTDTGTVQPGMSREEVIAVWGEPEAESGAGTRWYLYFRNGCEVTCGTFDVVFLDGGGVVDAIVRGQGHTYGGNSSSPMGRVAAYSPPLGR
jgi:hypothetical protein